MDIIANTNCGKIRGVKVKGNILRFTGIPFVKPPVGALRFKAPVDPEPCTGIKDTTEFGPVSIQPDDYASGLWVPPLEFNENNQVTGINSETIYLGLKSNSVTGPYTELSVTVFDPHSYAAVILPPVVFP